LKKIIRRCITVLLAISAVGLIVASSFDDLFVVHWQTENERLLKVAECYASPSDEMVLTAIGRFYDSSWREELWRARWETEKSGLLEVHLNPDTKELEFLLDSTDKECTRKISEINAREKAQITIIEFLENLKKDGFKPIPVEAVGKCIEKDEHGWACLYQHMVNGIRVHGDFIRIVTEPNGAHIREYSKNWHSIQKIILPSTDKIDAIEAIEEFGIKYVQKETSIEMKYIPLAGSYHLAWVINTPQFEIWVDAITSDILYIDSMLAPVGPHDGYVFALDIGYEPTYSCAESIYKRFDTAVDFPSAGWPYYLEDQLLSSYVDALEDSYVYYTIGHGGATWEGDDWNSFIATLDDKMFPGDVAPEDVSNLKLAFLCCCYTFGDGQYCYDYQLEEGHDIDKSIGQEFIDGDADCVFGWRWNIGKSPAIVYCKNFFDAAVNGLDFDECYDYAESKASSDTRDNSKIAKTVSSWPTLDVEDAGDYFTSATDLGSGGVRQIHVYDEGMWGYVDESWEDFDYFKFKITGQYDIEIWATPQGSYGFDLKMEIYDDQFDLIATCDEGGYYYEEHYQSTAAWVYGWYYVYIEHKALGRGGWFDLTIHVTHS
jgi:hypothetical protein